jgi:uncharacterized protein (TIGR02117 family)
VTAALRWICGAAILLVLAIAGGTLTPRPLWPVADAADVASRHILVLSNPIHTDIAIPVDDDLRRQFAFLNQAGVPIDHPGALYLVIGWGGRSFYLQTPTWGDLKPMPVFRALTIDSSVLHVDVAGAMRPDNPAVTRFPISEGGMRRLRDFVRDSFAGEDAAPQPIAHARYGRYDAFYAADGYFNAAVGCNTWTAGALREAGLRTGWWNPVPQTLAVSLDLFN